MGVLCVLVIRGPYLGFGGLACGPKVGIGPRM